MKRVAHEWGITSKVQAVVTEMERPTSLTVAIRSHTSFKHLICFAHILNLVVQNGVKIVKPLQEKVKAIVEHFCGSTVATDKL